MKKYVIMGTAIVFVGVISAYAATPSKQVVAKTDGSESNGTAVIKNEAGKLSLKSTSAGVEIERFTTEKSGVNLKEGDVIVKLEGRFVGTPEDIMSYVRKRPNLTAVALSVTRGGRIIKVNADAALFRTFMTPEPPTPPATPG